MSRVFYVQSRIFDCDITAKSKLVYVYLCGMANRKAASFPSRKTIAAACGLSLASIKRATKELHEFGLIDKATRHACNGRQTSNLYTIVKQDGAPFFYCDSEIFDYDIPTGAKLVFTYIRRCSTQGAAFPSYRQIAAACALSVTSVLQHVALLVDAALIMKEHQYRQNGGRSSNLYLEPEKQPGNVKCYQARWLINWKMRLMELHFPHLFLSYQIRPPPYGSPDPP